MDEEDARSVRERTQIPEKAIRSDDQVLYQKSFCFKSSVLLFRSRDYRDVSQMYYTFQNFLLLLATMVHCSPMRFSYSHHGLN